MANPEHLQILQQGVEAWNAWRHNNRSIAPDLREADLNDFSLDGVDLSSMDLTGAVFSGFFPQANLSGAALSRAIIWGVDLAGANLSGANLSNAELRSVDLTGANLTGAWLSRATLAETILTKADVSEVNLEDTIFVNSNLTAVVGLETCVHRGPSVLDHRTLAQSGPLPLAFLRGCGLPERLIEYLPSILNEPFQFYSCFISYAGKDRAFAERLHADLQNKGVRCWFAAEDMKIGDRIRPRIDETIRVYDKLLLVLSQTSVVSPWVEQEVETAMEQESKRGTTILFPVRIDNTVMTLETGWPALIRNTRHIGDFRGWKTHDVYRQAFDRLLRDLKAAERQPGS